MGSRIGSIMVSLLCARVLSLMQQSIAFDIITTSRPIHDGETIISAGGNFELGFFSPGDPSKRYIGIWYKASPVTVAWVANRHTPVTDGKGVFRVTYQGKLILQNGSGGIVWSSNASVAGYNPFAQILDTGNLVVRSEIDGNFLWQSFDYPTDTILGGMKIGINKTSGFVHHATSWRNEDDPSPGNFTYGIDISGYPELMLWQGSDIKYRSGPWDGVRWSGSTTAGPNRYYNYEVVLTDEEVYTCYELYNTSFITRLYLSPSGKLQRFTWIEDIKDWQLYLSVPGDNCDAYNICGPHGLCTITDSPMCTCLKGFIPKSPQQWNLTDWSQGCIRKAALECTTDIFVKYEEVKMPNTHHSWFNRSVNLEDCRNICKKNCSCMAYSNLDIRDGGSGCLQWYGNLNDIRTIHKKGQEIYIRLSAAESGLLPSGRKKLKLLRMELIVGLAAAIAGSCLSLYFLKKKISKKKGPTTGTTQRFQPEQTIDGEEDLGLPLFSISRVLTATGNFSLDNKIGEGGFGPVYKGVLCDGREVAVKKLSSTSKQGMDEMKNEVISIAKLQHRNLVKLLGCCIQEDNLLIYEYMPNGSLDLFLFNPMRRKVLDWNKRFNIITGIARGLIYLHHDSRLRIIHRDLKASNILLDKDMNPKISDFGLARGFTGTETAAKTNRVVGTYGYMSPEYAIDGAFSIKSDVFSYGVLVLEIVSGERNRGFYHSDHQHNLLGHAWKLFTQDGKPLELVDPVIEDSYDAPDVLRCIHVGLLCIQQCPEDRPNMSKVVMMLESDIELPFPKEPGFFNERKPVQSDNNSSSLQQLSSSNAITTTFISPR